MSSESVFVHDWCVFEDSEPSWNESTSFGLDFVVAATPVASPRRRTRRKSLASSLSQATDLSESSEICPSVQSEQLKSSSKTSPRAPRRLSQRQGNSSRSPNLAPPRAPGKKSTRRRSVSHSNDKLCDTMASCSLIDLMKINHVHVDTASSSSGSATPPLPEHNKSPRRRPVEENNAHSSPRRPSPRRTRRLVCMPQVGSATPALQSTENACSRRIARRMSVQG